MATAKVKACDRVKLTLTRAEAETLMDVVMRIGGHKDRSARRHTEAILLELARIGVADGNRPVQTGFHPNVIYFGEFA